MSYDDWKTTEPSDWNDYPLCPECEKTADKCRCSPDEAELEAQRDDAVDARREMNWADRGFANIARLK